MNLALNNLQKLTCNKIQTANQPRNQLEKIHFNNVIEKNFFFSSFPKSKYLSNFARLNRIYRLYAF